MALTAEASLTSRYVVGIDLGTTNSAVSYVDAEESAWRVRTFPVPQIVAPGVVEARDTLPSFHYQPAADELPAGALRLPWERDSAAHVVGLFARDQGTLAPGRLIVSAKSWLCHTGVDRLADLLPWHGAEDVDRLSPVEVSARYLGHLRAAWDAAHPAHPLAAQDLVITLPASFDEVARELTIKAAARAGLPRVVLIEEPQAAFYAWLDAHRDDWEQRVQAGQKILVCDVGGGTSDFTLIRVRRGEGDKIQFHRVAVGEHLILGGDNFDLALAQFVERRLTNGGKLEPRPWSTLVRACRQAKETLLGPQPPERLTIAVRSGGAKLIGGGLQCEVTRDEVQELLVEGFFPRVGLGERPAARRSGFQEFGLPYAPDPAITRNLAAFLSAHRHVAAEGEPAADHDPARPDVLLFNGGVFESPALRERLVESLAGWFAAPGSGWRPHVLDHVRLDLAVAHGAAYYGMVRRGHGVRIAAGLARSYYIGVGDEAGAGHAMCLLPAGVEPGQDIELADRQFELLVSEPVEFPLYVSSTRLTDAAGALVPLDREQLTPLPPIRTVLSIGKKRETGRVPVRLHARLTELGTLDLWCSERDGRREWRLQFDVRCATQTDVAAHSGTGEQQGILDESVGQACRALIAGAFGPDGQDSPETLMKRLAAATGVARKDWPASLLRQLWEMLLEHERGRRRSQIHEARWLNLVGFTLRPGYGLAVDDWRVSETWRVLQGRLAHATPMCRAEWWILWRRIAGGLAAGRQRALIDPVLPAVRGLHKAFQKPTGRAAEFPFGSHEAAEVWRLLGSLELLDLPLKRELGGMLVDLLGRQKLASQFGPLAWALGRMGARQPAYGPLNVCVPLETVSNWLDRLLRLDLDEPLVQFALMELARRTGDRYRDVSDGLRGRVLERLAERAAPAHFLDLVREVGTLAEDEQGLVFGEALPRGLRIL